MQHYMNLQGLSPFSHSSPFNPSLLSAAHLQAAHLTSAALQQAAASTVAGKTDLVNDAKINRDEKSETMKNLSHSIDRLLKKDESKKESKPDSDDHISSTSDDVESELKGKVPRVFF